MPVRKNVFFDPKFNEWFYDAILHISAEQKSSLNRTELYNIRNSSATKSFVANENLEKKLTFLSKVGIQWGLLFFKDTEITKELVKKAYKQYSKTDGAISLIDEMVDNKVFVMHARDVATSLALMSNSCHSNAYIINPNFYSFRKSMKGKYANISKKNDFAAKNANVLHEDAARASLELARMVSETMTLDNYLGGVHGLTRLDAMILLALFQNKLTYVSVDRLKIGFAGQYKPASIGNRCVWLFRQAKLIDKRPADEKVQTYMITQAGILKVGEILNYLLNRVYE